MTTPAYSDEKGDTIHELACNQPPEPPKVMVITNIQQLSRRMSRTASHRYSALSRHDNVTLTGPGGMPVQDLLGRFGRPDFIIHGLDLGATGIPLVSGLENLDIPKAMEIEDTWENPEGRQRFLRANRFDYAFHTTRPRETVYQEACPDTRFVWTPMAVRTAIFRDYGMEQVNDVLLYGAVRQAYPLRVRLLKLLENLDQSSGIRVKIIPHPGYWDDGYVPQEGHYVGEDLAREINRSWISIATGSEYGCMFAKHFEIAAAKSLVAGSLPGAARPFLGRGFEDLDAKEDDEIIDRLRFVLGDKDELIARTEEGRRLIHANFSVEAYSRNMLDLIACLVASGDRKAESPTFSVYS